ncbi:MAG: Rrf2 family transcriptional regulator, partial [Candidatus Omnitrophica bacterium CG12_big_fil_rev_8_21_14_0_65_45_16]
MKFTTKTEYGVICLIYLARHADKAVVAIKDIVRDEKLSPAYIEKILQKLKQAGIVTSAQGNQGGFSLARKPSEINFRQIVE